MALSWVLTVLSLLPLLEAQIHLPVPITNPFAKRGVHKSVQEIQATFFYFTPNKTEDTIFLREYQTDQTSAFIKHTYLNVQYGEASPQGRQHKWGWMDTKTYMLAFDVNDEKNWGLSVYADKPETTKEQLGEFYEDKCEPLEKQHEKERKQEEGES
uniref:Uncharacterized protein n=1 Tax=Pan troglodytes TaxID=9598 RepID=A0A2I3RN00_PANTR